MANLRNLISKTPKLATNYIVLSGAEFISKLLSAVAFAYLGRVLGPQVYGHLEFALAIVIIGTLLVDFGLSTIGAREIAKDAKKTPGLFVHITLMRFILAVCTVAIITIIAYFVDQPESVKLLILLYGFSLLVVPLLIQWVYQGHDWMHYVAIASMLRWSIFTFSIFVFVHNFGDVWIIPLIEAFALICVAVLLGLIYLRSIGTPKFRFDPQLGLQIFRNAIPIGASELVWAVKVYFATIIIGLIISGPGLGWFTSAHRIVISLHAFVWLYFYNLLPSISRSSQYIMGDYQKLMKNSLKITSWVAVFVGIMGTAYARVVIGIFYGEQYWQAANVFQILIWLIPLTILSGHYRYSLIGYNHQKKEFISAAIGAVVIVILNLVLIPGYGYIGAAWAIILSETAIWFTAWLFVKRSITHIPVIPFIWQPILAGVIAAVLLFVLTPYNIWIAGVITVVVYALLFLFAYPKLIYRLRAIFANDQISQA